jgi:hypothetical protein
MATRDVLKAPHHEPAPAETLPEPRSQRKRPEPGRYRLEVDRQMKGSFMSFEEAQTAGIAIKTKHPIVRVAIYDVTEGINTDIQLPSA